MIKKIVKDTLGWNWDLDVYPVPTSLIADDLATGPSRDVAFW